MKKEDTILKICAKRTELTDKAIFGTITEIIKDNECLVSIEVNETAIVEALEKQIPKKPETEITNRGIDISGEYDIDNKYLCSVCGCVVGDCEAEDHWFEYCPHCGQALDWSDTYDKR